MFDVLVDELRTHSTEWLESRRCRAGDREERAGALVEGTTRGAVPRREVSGHLCGRRRGLEVHHLVPRSWHGTADISNLAAVCPAHHQLLIPHALLALVGNPNLPDGLQLVTASRAPPNVAV